MCQLKGIEAGADRIDTAISSFANGTSHPATEAQVAALKNTPYDTGLDLTLLGEIANISARFAKNTISLKVNLPAKMYRYRSIRCRAA